MTLHGLPMINREGSIKRGKFVSTGGHDWPVISEKHWNGISGSFIKKASFGIVSAMFSQPSMLTVPWLAG